MCSNNISFTASNINYPAALFACLQLRLQS